MSWNYRIIRHPGKFGSHYQLHEVFYNAKGRPVNATEEAVTFGGDSQQEVIDSLHQALGDVLRTRVIDWEDL
jgi:hypothetical protein